MGQGLNIKRESVTSGIFGKSCVRNTLLSTALFSGLLLVLIGILLFLSRHEPDPTPDQLGLVQHVPSAPVLSRS